MKKNETLINVLEKQFQDELLLSGRQTVAFLINEICENGELNKEKINTNNLRGRNISVSEAMEICTEVISFANLVFEFYKYKKDKNETVEKKELKKIIRDDTKILTETQKEEIIELIDKEFND